MPERLGLFGGTFDPVHVGHLVTAVNVRHALRLDRLLLVPAGDPWQKAGRRLAPAVDRLAMVEAAVAGVDGLEACDIEVRRAGPSYTADTVAELLAEERERELYVVVGSDAAALLATWERPEEIRTAATLVVVHRPGAEADRPPAEWRHEVVEVPQFEVSSSEVRARLRDGRPIDFLVTPGVRHLIAERGLYAPAP